MSESTKTLPKPQPQHHRIRFPFFPMIYSATLFYSTVPIPNNAQPKPHPEFTKHPYHHPFSIRIHIPTTSPTLTVFYSTVLSANAYAYGDLNKCFPTIFFPLFYHKHLSIPSSTLSNISYEKSSSVIRNLRREEVVFALLRIGHTIIPQLYLLNWKQQPFCIPYNHFITVKSY